MTFLLGSTLKVSLVILAGLALAAALRRHSAAARHSIVASAILCALAMPLLELIVPTWGVMVPGSAVAPAPTDAGVSRALRVLRLRPSQSPRP